MTLWEWCIPKSRRDRPLSVSTATNHFFFFFPQKTYFSSWATATVVWFPYCISHFLSSGVSGGAWRQWMFHQGFSPDTLSLPMPNCLAWAVKHCLPQPGRARHQKTNHSPSALGRDWAPSEPAHQWRAAGASMVLWEIMAELLKVIMPLLLGYSYHVTLLQRGCVSSLIPLRANQREAWTGLSTDDLFPESLYPSSVSPLQS